MEKLLWILVATIIFTSAGALALYSAGLNCKILNKSNFSNSKTLVSKSTQDNFFLQKGAIHTCPINKNKSCPKKKKS